MPCSTCLPEGPSASSTFPATRNHKTDGSRGGGHDAVMLVVAADDGVMPQTKEHLEILTLLGIKNGITVINKIDLVDEEMLELAKDDIYR